ncbi:MAG TPA: hypothetical protein VF337_01800 [Candidatus Limnocylindrales bacterium]
MWHETPQQQLMYINQQHSDSISMADGSRLFRMRRRAVEAGESFVGLRIHLGALLIVVGRTLCDEDALRHNAAHS